MARTRTKKPAKFAKKRSSVRSRKTAFRSIRKKNKSAVAAIPRSITKNYGSPFPNFKLVKHKYTSRVTVPAATAAGFCRGWMFRANDTYDPDYTGFGHQPLYRDEMAAQYERYQVLKSNIKFIIPNEQSTSQHWTCYMDEENTFAADYVELVENRGLRTPICKLDKATSPIVMYSNYDIKKDNPGARLADLIADDDRLIAKAASPAAPLARYYKLASFPTDATVTLAAISILIHMEIWAVWSQPADVLPS
jgi:hypothetical protein